MANDKPRVISTFDDDKNTKLHFAAARGDTDEVSILIEKKHKIDIENNLGWTPLMMATRNGHLKAVKTLLEARADATRKNKFGGSIFLMAVSSGNMDILHTILEHLLYGGVSKQIMEYMFSPLSVAILFNYEHVFNYLVRKGFSVKAQSPKSGLTPLMFAARSENPSYYSKLLTEGASQTAKNINGETSQELVLKKRGTIYYDDSHMCMQHPHQHPHHTVPKVMMFSPQPVYQMVPAQAQPHTPSHLQPHQYVYRKSSNTATPNCCPSPAVSPIGYYPHVFFPPDFSPSQVISPTNCYVDDQLNSAIMSHTYPHTPSHLQPHQYIYRKSSNAGTPNCCPSPSVSPIGYCPQLFFPPNFSQSQMISPTNCYMDDPLNSGMMPITRTSVMNVTYMNEHAKVI